jgi:hypothetical protein
VKLLAAKGPLEFQALNESFEDTTPTVYFDPSDAAEAKRYASLTEQGLDYGDEFGNDDGGRF